jgi:hypothetical protein
VDGYILNKKNNETSTGFCKICHDEGNSQKMESIFIETIFQFFLKKIVMLVVKQLKTAPSAVGIRGLA